MLKNLFGQALASTEFYGCRVLFDAGDGTPAVTKKMYYLGSDVYGALQIPTRMGYVFGGWRTDTDEEVTEVTTLKTVTNHTLRAKWTANTYTLTLDAEGGAVSPASKSVTYDAAYGELPVPARTGYTFGGWWTGDNGTGTQVTGDTTVTTAANHTLYAKWTANAYTLTLDAEGGAVSPASKSVTYDAAYGELPVPARGGYRFVGWWTGDNGTGTQMTGDTTVTTAANQTLHAKWTEDPYLCPPEGADPLSSVGSYDGFFYSELDFDGTPASAVRGTLSLTVSTLSGKLTAKGIIQKRALNFRTSIWNAPDSDGVHRAVMTTSGGEMLDLYVGQNRIWGTLSGGSLDGETLTLDGMRNRFVDHRDIAAQTLLNSFRGYYTVAMPISGALSLGAANAAPEGSGYLALTVGDHGMVTIVGVLADGVKVTHSSRLILFNGCGPEACVPFFVPLYSRTGWVGGLLWLDPVKRTIGTDRDLGWFLRWEKSGAGVDGFSELLDACGGFYNTLDALAMHYRFSAQTNAVPYFHGRGIAGRGIAGRGVASIQPVFPVEIGVAVSGTSLTITKGVAPVLTGGAYDYSASENSSMATLTFQPATGIFKGYFRLYYDYMLSGRLKHKIESVPYTGVLTPVRPQVFDGMPAGQGYYLVPDNTPAFVPYRLKRSYLIELDDAE